MEFEQNKSLLPYNTFGIDAKAAYFAEYSSEEELAEILDEYHRTYAHLPLLHIGGGSNLLFLSDFSGLVLHSRILGIHRMEPVDSSEILVRVGAGVVWDDLVSTCISHGWYGLENLSLIPGEVGASAVQNIGAYGSEVKDFIQFVECLSLSTGEKRVFQADECSYAYRNSIFKHDLKGQFAVTHVTYRLSSHFVPCLDYGGLRAALESQGISEDVLTAQQLREAIIGIRKAKLPDPKVLGNAGSFFMNPIVSKEEFQRVKSQYSTLPSYPFNESHVKVPAAWLIEQTGWKGRSLGPAAVHDRQALVLVNLGGATGQDILRLCDEVRSSVFNKFGINLCPEVNFIGG